LRSNNCKKALKPTRDYLFNIDENNGKLILTPALLYFEPSKPPKIPILPK
jgi:hypothetical protein